MRYAIFTDIHANLEALEAVLTKIDEIAQEEPIDQIWFLGDLVGYGPNPNECITKLRARTNVIIAGNHDWAAVGKIDLEDFSEAARLSALWTAKQLTEEHRSFLANLPERLEKNECLLVHGSPYGPLWEYLTSEVLAERSFQQFTNRFCFVGHTHVPVIFLQPDTFANAPTMPLPQSEIVAEQVKSVIGDEETAESKDVIKLDEVDDEYFNEETQKLEDLVNGTTPDHIVAQDEASIEDAMNERSAAETAEQETTKIVALRSTLQSTIATAIEQDGGPDEAETLQDIVANAADMVAEIKQHIADDNPDALIPIEEKEDAHVLEQPESEEEPVAVVEEEPEDNDAQTAEEETPGSSTPSPITPEEAIVNAEERLNEEIEELLALLGLSQSMISVTNEMLIPPEGEWQASKGHRAIINPGGVGQPRDGDSRAAFMVYDTERGFTFYRVSYDIEKTQEKIIKAGLPEYLATRLAYGR